MPRRNRNNTMGFNIERWKWLEDELHRIQQYRTNRPPYYRLNQGETR